MKRIATLASAICLAVMAGAASAETFTFEFNYNAGQSADANYATLQRAARRACGVDLRIAGGVSEKSRSDKACTANLIDQTVAQIGHRDLRAHHDAITSARHAQGYAQLD